MYMFYIRKISMKTFPAGHVKKHEKTTGAKKHLNQDPNFRTQQRNWFVLAGLPVRWPPSKLAKLGFVLVKNSQRCSNLDFRL